MQPASATPIFGPRYTKACGDSTAATSDSAPNLSDAHRDTFETRPIPKPRTHLVEAFDALRPPHGAAVPRDGFATFTALNGIRYEGMLRDGLPHGNGKETQPSGTCYVGGFIAGLREGDGEMLFADRTYIRGTFKDGFPDGWCLVNYASGARYRGGFKRGLYDGAGRLERHDPEYVYIGSWDNGARHGVSKEIINGVGYSSTYDNGVRRTCFR